MATKAMSYFRKHQKVILACITIGTMLVFIVGDAVQAMGRGGSQNSGIISWFKNLFGGAKEDTIFRVAGTNYNEEKLKQLQEQRALAYEFSRTVENVGGSRFVEGLGFKDDDLKDQTKAQQLRQRYEEMRAKDPTIAEAESSRDSALLKQIQPSIAVFSGQEPYESISEFLHMKAKANSLGITVTNSMIRDDLMKLGMGKVTLDEITNLARNMGRRVDLAKLDSILSVLADEVKVSIAKKIGGLDLSQAALSRAGQARMITPQVTPADMWANYVLVKSSLSVGILPLKVEDYLSRVGEPTLAEKQALYDKYKKDYPNPLKDTPGFKIPPMYRIGLIFADMKPGSAAQKFYNGQVEAYDRLAPLNALAELANMYQMNMGNYRNYTPFIEFATTKAITGPWVRVYRWQSQQNQAQLAGILGHLALAGTQVGTFNPGNAFAMTLNGEAVSPRQNEALSVIQAVAGATSLTGLLQPAMSMRVGVQENYIPFSVVAPALIEKRLETNAKRYLNNDLDEVSKVLSTYARKYSEWRGKVLRKLPAPATPPLYNDETKQTLQDYLTKFANARGLSYYETKELRSKNDLLNEPGERLLNTFVKPLYISHSERQSQRAFEDFLRTTLVKDELGGSKPKLFETSNSDVEDSAHKNKETVLHWVAEATEPRVPDFKDADAAVTKAWKMEKARADAQAEADKIVKEVNTTPDNFRKLIDMKGYVPGQVIARFSEPEIKSMADTPTYIQALVPKVIDNEPNDFINTCFEKLKKKGDAIVIPDKSKTTYYVIYLSNRSEPKTNNPLDLEAFHNEVIRPSMLKQMTVNGTSFRNFVSMVKKEQEVNSWIEFLKGVTGMNSELLKKNSPQDR